jgi:sugar/nucleoside kinase (ribokinase family)
VSAIFVGRSTLDLVYACAGSPEPDGKVDATIGYRTGGGPALNAAVAFSALGGRARLCSQIGEGPFAEEARADLRSQGVELFDVAAGQGDILPVSSIILTGASRAIVNQPLPDRAGSVPHEMLERLFETRPDIVLSDGHLPELAAPILMRARQLGVTTMLDGGSWKPWTQELLPLVDIAIVSSRFRPPAADGVLNLRAIAAFAVTNGPNPILWRQGEDSGEVRPPKVEAVDTLGAGDLFHGAVCHALATGSGFPESLTFAAGIAASSCAHFGPRAWIAARS